MLRAVRAILVARAAENALDMAKIAAQLTRFNEKKLGFVDEAEKLDKMANEWIVFLVRFGVRREFAKSIVRNAAMIGSDLDARDPLDVYSQAVLGSNGLRLVLFAAAFCQKRASQHP
jgi:hypothetical protein